MTQAASQFAPSRRSFLKGSASLACVLTAGKAASTFAAAPAGGGIHVYAGSYTNPVDGGANGEGIYLLELDARTGELSEARLAAKTRNPSWICIHPSRRYLYAINEITDFNGSSGSVSAFSIQPESGELTLLNSVSSEGAGPAHMSLDATGKFAFVANYAGGSIAVLPILAGGRLGSAVYTHRDLDSIGAKQATDAPRGSFAISGHDASHAHMIAPGPNNQFVLSTNLGQDRIYVYHFDVTTGKLKPLEGAPFVSLPTGDGPRHFVFHPNGRWLYSLQEEASTIALFLFDPALGSLTPQKTISALPAGFAGTSFASEIQVSRDGRFLYSANRLYNSISVFSITDDGSLQQIDEVWTRGDYPRYFQFGPTGDFLYVCNQRSDSITSFKVHRDTGRLTFTGRYTAVGTPAFLACLA